LFSDRLRNIREHLGISQRELNRRCGFSEHTIHQYEVGRSIPSMEHLKVLAEQLKVSSDYLIGLSIDPIKLGDCDLNDDERNVLEVLRREGWLGVIRFCTERMAKSS
jgi:transcriptional regulator with XRE-family HTH domain